MYETVSIPLSDLLLDTGNARLGEEQQSQQAVYLALAKQQGRRLLTLAEDIVNSGTDPTALPAVVATGDQYQQYRIIEGNRRILALKALDTPTIVSGALNSGDQKRLAELAGRYAENPTDEVACVLFESEEEAYHWVELRHTGANDGAGLVEWDANEQDRFRTRHGQRRTRTAAGQILDFIERIDGPPSSKTKILTTLQRLINTRYVRDALGIDRAGDQLLSHYPLGEVRKGLERIVGDLRNETIKVKDVYDIEDRQSYIDGLPKGDLPDPKRRLEAPVALMDLADGYMRPPKEKTRRRTRAKPPRTSVVPRDCKISPGPPRINAIFNELLNLNADSYPNACAVLLRVFVEVSVDHEIDKHSLMSESERSKQPLSKRLKALANHMHTAGRINDQLKKAVIKIADSQHTIAASTTTFNQYVHNRYVHPKPSEVRTAWDELQPFLEQVWA